MNEIKFGTDGWRDVIGDSFTFENVRKVSQAACDVIRKTSKSRLILIGYDRRFFSDRFAEEAGRVAAGNGFKVEMSHEPITSPTLSFHVKTRKAALGFMITASHNPYQFNGFKLKGPHGGSVDEALTAQVEDRVGVSEIQTESDPLKKVNFEPAYLAQLKKYLKVPNISALKGPVIFDALHGPGGVFFEQLVGTSSKLQIIRKEVDPLFGAVNPEPIETNLAALKAEVLKQKASIGIAVDGDADRIGLVDEKGNYLPPPTVMPLLLLHLIEGKKLKGKVIQTVSMGYLNQRIATQFGLPFEEVPVGFKYIAKKMLTEKVLFGGEESGGYGCGYWSPERDGLLCALIILDMMVARKQPLSEIVADMKKRFGESTFKRVDFKLRDAVEKGAWTQHIASHVGADIAGVAVKTISTMDGIKITRNDESWVLMRPSGTEPLLRTYAEGPTPASVDAMLVEAQRLVSIPMATGKKGDKDKSGKGKKKKNAKR